MTAEKANNPTDDPELQEETAAVKSSAPKMVDKAPCADLELQETALLSSRPPTPGGTPRWIYVTGGLILLTVIVTGALVGKNGGFNLGRSKALSSRTKTASPSMKSSAMPSDQPSLVPSSGPTDQPSDTPSAAPTDKPSLAPTVTPSPTRPVLPDDYNFRLKMHYEDNYCWQDECIHREYCLECVTCPKLTTSGAPRECSASECSSGDQFVINYCNGYRSGSGNVEFEIIRLRFSADLIKVKGKDLCWERNGNRFVWLQPCDVTNDLQWFDGFDHENPMTLRNLGGSGEELYRCLSQHHWPKKGEALYLEECQLALGYDTGLWDAI